MKDTTKRPDHQAEERGTVLRGLHLFARWIVVALVGLMVIAGTVALAIDIGRSMAAAPALLLDSG